MDANGAEGEDAVAVIPVPASVAGCRDFKMSLGGTWDFTSDAPLDLCRAGRTKGLVERVVVPGNLDSQGMRVMVPIEQCGGAFDSQDWSCGSVPCAYHRKVTIPEWFEGRRIFLKMEKGAGKTEVWFDGELVQTHVGGHTEWDCELTKRALPGETHDLALHLKNGSGACETEFINYFGLIGEVTLLALPDSYIASLHYVTEFDADYRDARLRISVFGVFPRKEGAISITVREVDGSRVSEDHRFELAGGSGPYTASVWVDNPRHWTAEAPHLYVLSAALIVDGVEVETIERRVGFRQVEIQGDEMYVNGQRVKLRGVNFLAYYALSGLYVPPEVEERCLRTLKAGNVNYLRTAHFPRTTHFYDLCDRLGFYVESEHSVVWSVRSRRENADRRQRLVAPLREMIERDKSHPSIVFWSIGNECEWDEHFQLMYDHVKKADPSRPVKVSWGTDAVDLYSVHYPSIRQQMGGRNKPTIYDEYCHLLDGKGDNPEQVRFDPGVRDHFGMQVQAYWDKIYRSEGALGGAIWNGVDTQQEAWQRFSGNGCGWGILDSWGREKPEYYNMKKAYSPVVARGSKHLRCPEDGEALELDFENRFLHTGFGSLSIHGRVNGGRLEELKSEVPPFGIGSVSIPGRSWKLGDRIEIRFRKECVEEAFRFSLGKPRYRYRDSVYWSDVPEVGATPVSIDVSTADLLCRFDRSTGDLAAAYWKGEPVLRGGPYVNWGIAGMARLHTHRVTASRGDRSVLVTIEAGLENEYVPNCTIEVDVYASGLIRTRYRVSARPEDASEVGIGYRVDDSADRHLFRRDGRWSCHPADHIGRDEGTAARHPPDRRVYGQRPEWPWASDEIDFHLYGRMDAGGRGTNDFRGSKHNILYSELQLTRRGRTVCCVGRGAESVRLSPLPGGQGVHHCFNNHWAIPQSAPWNEIGGNDVYRAMRPQAGEVAGTANLFIGDRQDIVMDYLEV